MGRKGGGSEPRPVPPPGCPPHGQATRLWWLLGQTHLPGERVARPEKAQLPRAIICSGDKVTQPPDVVPAIAHLALHLPAISPHFPLFPAPSPGWAPSPLPLPYPGEEKQGCEGQYWAVGFWKDSRRRCGTGMGRALAHLASEVSNPLPDLQERQRLPQTRPALPQKGALCLPY